MIEITLTEEERNNLLVFLKRANLKGEEVPEYVKIINKINEGKKVRDKEI